MGRSGNALCRICLFLPLLSASARGELRLFMIPQGQDPTSPRVDPIVINLRTLETVTLDIFVESDDPVALVRVTLVLPDPAKCGESAGGGVVVLRAAANTTRPDALFHGSDGGAIVFGGAALIFSGSITAQVVTTPKFCGEITYAAAEDACGEFLTNLTDAVYMEQGQTQILSDTGNPLPFSSSEAVIHVGNDGDVNHDGTVDLFDILCVLDGFEGRFDRCTLVDVDVAPCFLERGDGTVRLEDILVVLEAFAGNDPCPPPGCGAPRCPP